MHWGEWAEPEGVLECDPMTVLLRPKQEEAALSIKFSDGAKEAYNYHFVKDDDINTERQSKLVRPLTLGLIEGKTKEKVLERLADLAIKREYKIGTGFLSTPFILPVLAENGHIEKLHIRSWKIQKNQDGLLWWNRMQLRSGRIITDMMKTIIRVRHLTITIQLEQSAVFYFLM